MKNLFTNQCLSVSVNRLQEDKIRLCISSDFSGSSRKSQLYVNEGRVSAEVESFWKNTKTKMSAYSALTRKKHGKTYVSPTIKKLLATVDTIVADMPSDHREIVQYQDMLDLIERNHIKLNDEKETIVRGYLGTKYDIH